MDLKRLNICFILGVLAGVVCLIGNMLTGATPYLIAAWYNRVILGVLIGLAGELKIYKEEDNIINSILRGAFIGAFVSLGFAFFLGSVLILFFLAGIVFGIVIDLIATLITK